MAIEDKLNGKFIKMKKFIDKIEELEKIRTVLKKQLREKLSDPMLSINTIIEYAVVYQRELGKLSTRIQNLYGLYNRHWFALTYEDKVRYRYWSNGKKFPGFEMPGDQGQKAETPSDRQEDRNIPVNEPKELRPARSYFKIDRGNAQKLCSKLIEFLSGQDQFFKVGFDETHSS
jgi:hypothetical protein